MASRISLSARLVKSLSLTILALSVAFAPITAFPQTKAHWVATWATSNVTMNNADANAPLASARTPPSFQNQTLREIVHTTIGGSSIRIRLSNVAGTQPVTFDSVFIGMQKDDANLVPGSNHQVTFGGSKSVTIREGAEAISDPVSLSVDPQQNLAISLYSAASTGPATTHTYALQANYLSESGNAAANDGGSPFAKTNTSWFFLAAVDVLAPQTVAGAIVALGDSITDGASSTPGTNGRWTDVLARRLLADHTAPAKSVLNAGIGGNRILTSSPCWGENALARLDRDVFAQAGAEDIILFEGTNDIGQPDTPTASLPPHVVPCLSKTQITADDLITGYKQIIAQAHARGLKIIGATILPYQGFRGWTAQGEAKRKAANDWIKTGRQFDGVIDFDAALADPTNAARMKPEYDSGDHLHPSPAGHKAMGEAIDLALIPLTTAPP